jgi:tRNA G18 (ribose-2'-O)-methylase SpoU
MIKIKDLYEEGRLLEKNFSELSPPSIQFLEFIEKLKNLNSSSSMDLIKISELANRLNSPWSLRKFLDLLIPLERLYQKNLTDADWLHNTPDKDPLLNGKPSRVPFIVVADHIRSAFNVGSLLRCADAFAVEKIIFTGYSPLPNTSSVQKTALGAQDHIAWSHFEHTEDAIQYLKETHYKIFALETSPKAQNLYHSRLPSPIALILGNERFGLNANILNQCDGIIQIPMLGIKNSLNVSTAFAIVAYEWHRQQYSVNG